VIQFACPSCSSTCGVDDRFKGRKLRCPKCGARVLHIADNRVELLSGGTAPAPAPTTAPATPGAPPPQDVTPLATAVMPHSMGELINESESKQNFHIGIGLLVLFAVAAVVLGFVLGLKLLVVAPFAVLLSAAGIYLWLHTRKLKHRLEERKAASAKK
jgi:hypothetical protein